VQQCIEPSDTNRSCGLTEDLLKQHSLFTWAAHVLVCPYSWAADVHICPSFCRAQPLGRYLSHLDDTIKNRIGAPQFAVGTMWAADVLICPRRSEPLWFRRKLWAADVLICPSKFLGGDSDGVTPGPIPNTVVKPVYVDGTTWETAWESRKPPGLNQAPNHAHGWGFLV
jgi:hypothetical protein